MKFSDEMINAYADGELQGSEKAEFEAALLSDVELQRTLDGINLVKEQLRHAYQKVDMPAKTQHKSVNRRVASYVGFLILAFSGGWISGDMLHDSKTAVVQAELLAQQQMKEGIEDQGKFILHVGIHDNKKFKRTLDKAEALMASYKNDQQSIELEVIANAGGLDLFREGASPYAERVKELSKQYPNIKFIACTNAIERLREHGIEPNLINTVHKGPTALDQVVMRMNEGWTYIKI